MSEQKKTISINEEVDVLKVNLLCDANGPSLEIYFGKDLVFKQIHHDKDNKIQAIIDEYPIDKKKEYIASFINNINTFITKKHEDLQRANGFVHIYNTLYEMANQKYYILDNKISHKTISYLNELELAGRIKKSDDGKYELIIGNARELVNFCYDRGFIRESKDDVDDLTPEIIHKYIKLPKCKLATLQKYFTDVRNQKK